MSTHDVLIPCRRFEVEVVLGAHDGLSVVEQFVLRAVAAGAATFEALASVLGLPDRMVLDTAIDLLARGLVDIKSGEMGRTLEVHASVEDAIGDPGMPKNDWYLAFHSADLPEPRTIPLAQDLVAGEVFLARRVPPIDRPRLPMMPDGAVCELDEIPMGTLLTAVTHAFRTGRGQEVADDLRGDLPRVPRDARVLNVRLRRSGPPGGAAHHVDARSMPLMAQVVVADRGEENPPRVMIVAPDAIPVRVRRSISATLDDLWLRGFARGQRQFFDRIRPSMGVDEEPRVDALETPAVALTRFEDAFAAASTDLLAQHTELATLDDEIRPPLERVAGYAADAELVVGNAASFRTLALDALREASRQVVLACPWITRLGRDEVLQSAVRAAVQRGVTVALAWGIDDQPLPEADAARAFLAALEQEARAWPGALAVALRGAASHAKVIVCDVDWAVVSSCNFLSAPSDRIDREVGVKVRIDRDGAVPLTIQDVLGWVRRLIPDYLVQERCIDAPMLFERTERRGVFALGEPVLPPRLDIAEALREVAISTWRVEWERRRVSLRDLATTCRGAVMPILDSHHRDLFVRSIAGAQRRLLVASHQVRPQGLSEPVTEALLAAIARSVDVRIWHDATAYLEVEPLAKQRIDRLRDAGATVVSAATHAKVLVCDEWGLVSSHNFLSLDPSTRSAHEIGLQLFDPTLVDALWSAFESPS